MDTIIRGGNRCYERGGAKSSAKTWGVAHRRGERKKLGTEELHNLGRGITTG